MALGDLQHQLEHLERQAADCDQLARLAIDDDKREIFRRLADQYKAMAENVRLEIAGKG
jgi:hypothetical protein